MSRAALPGFRDFYPQEMSLRNRIFSVWRSVATRYGFEEYDGPPLEPLDLYTAKSGDEIVGQLYNFVDKGDREVALRPEMTPTLARMVTARANGLKKPIRWFSIPQLFRYERQQRGRLREHYQLNCDLVGEAGPVADAEIVALSIDIMRELGLGPGDVRVRVSDRGLISEELTRLGVAAQDVPRVFAAIDRVEKDPAGARAMLHEVAPHGADQIFELTQGGAGDELRSRALKHQSLGKVFETLDALGFGDWIEFDPTIVRGLAYYTGTVFELYDAKRSLRAICGGGRYDHLLDAMGGVNLPAVGFGMGDVVLSELLKERGLVPEYVAAIDVLVAYITSDDMPAALQLVRTLRDHDVRTEFALSPAPIGKQLTLANARHARFAAIVGPDDRERGEVQLRDLTQKTQRAISSTSVAAEIAALLGRHTSTTSDAMTSGAHG